MLKHKTGGGGGASKYNFFKWLSIKVTKHTYYLFTHFCPPIVFLVSISHGDILNN